MNINNQHSRRVTELTGNLDLYPNSFEVISLRRTLVSNPVVAKISSGGINADFTGTDFEDGTVLNFVGNNPHFLKGLYGHNTGAYFEASNQNIIVVSNNELITINNHPSWYMPGNSYFSSTPLNNINSAFIKAQTTNDVNIGYVFYQTGNSTYNNGGMWLNGYNPAVNGIGLYINPGYINSGIEDFDPHYATFINDNSNSNIYVDGNLSASGISRNYNINTIGRNQNGLSVKGKVAEMVFYQTDETLNRIAIETTIKTY